MTPEEKLLVSFCRLQFTDKQKAGISEIIKQVSDWRSFTRLANEHGIIALAAHNIKESGLEKEIPGASMAILENGLMLSLVRNTWLTECWQEVNAILCKSNIKHVLLKGMALEHTIYGARGLRQMNDNDILIRYDDAIRSWNLLQQKGFKRGPVKSPLFSKIIPGPGHHLPPLYKNGYILEIHYGLSQTGIADDLDTFDPIESAVEIDIRDTKALTLPVDKHLMFLADHFKKHTIAGHCQLRMYTDIIMLDEETTIRVPDSFISQPNQKYKPEYRKAAYKATIRSLPAKQRWRFVAGDMFPTIKWMKNRFKCDGLKAFLHYPVRVGKILWLIS